MTLADILLTFSNFRMALNVLAYNMKRVMAKPADLPVEQAVKFELVICDQLDRCMSDILRGEENIKRGPCATPSTELVPVV